jgi:hypothetical protein
MLILGENVGSTVLNVKSLAWPGPSWVELGSADVRRQKMGLSITREIVEKASYKRLMENVHPAAFAAGRNPEK